MWMLIRTDDATGRHSWSYAPKRTRAEVFIELYFRVLLAAKRERTSVHPFRHGDGSWQTSHRIVFGSTSALYPNKHVQLVVYSTPDDCLIFQRLFDAYDCLEKKAVTIAQTYFGPMCSGFTLHEKHETVMRILAILLEHPEAEGRFIDRELKRTLGEILDRIDPNRHMFLRH